ncbi:uncharacterized protein NPIL_432921 [Nephila pilipes]|uniref:Uncharacterized protein n=1 Tax=Nephila pilipes TaxID=299642 RepID=A0A8X6TJD0_NEPPI|nr:uncharacterized protein NPIL_432921 [Nephila pilipes]
MAANIQTRRLETRNHEGQGERQYMGFQDQDIRTSDVYKTENLPFRFDHPSKWNYGNCVFTTCDSALDKYSSKSFAQNIAKSAKREHILFRTTNSDYGSKPPCVHTMPHTFHPRNHKYWEHLANVGMYRNRGFNTGIDRSRV